MHASLLLLTHTLRTPGEKLTTLQPAVYDLHRHAFFFGRDPVYSIIKEEKKRHRIDASNISHLLFSIARALVRRVLVRSLAATHGEPGPQEEVRETSFCFLWRSARGHCLQIDMVIIMMMTVYFTEVPYSTVPHMRLDILNRVVSTSAEVICIR